MIPKFSGVAEEGSFEISAAPIIKYWRTPGKQNFAALGFGQHNGTMLFELGLGSIEPSGMS
jgi:hypothetical protein